ncbi:MAG: class I adenylate-forming enzyme family protein [Gammaproteobacteria bacterium]|nr:class I adenylate-forming enzyme family protein [Gammaproteobacteria bacterium]
MTMYDQYWEVRKELTAPGAQFEIEEVEVRGNRIRSFTNAPPSLREVWLASAAFAERDYLVYHDERITYAEAHRQVASIACWLAEHGVQPGDRVAIAMRNYPEWLLAYWAIVAMGATVVGVNAWWVGRELVFGLNDSEPKVLIADQERLERILEHREEIPAMTMVGVRVPSGLPEGVAAWQDLVSHGGQLPDVQVDPDSDACIFYTSGTTGHPKGAQLTHRGCVANIMNMAFAATLQTTIGQRNGTIPIPEEDAEPPATAALLTTPLFHVTANNCVTHGTTLNGGKLVGMYKWDATEALKLIERERITAVTGVPVMSRELITHPDFDQYDTSSLMSVGGGGAQLQPDLVGKIDKRVATARPNTGYGMTETCGIITSISGDFFVDKPDSCGPAMPSFEAKVVDADGNALPSGEVGELWVKGAPVIKGYLNRPDATAESITDGWLHTGDIARIDEDDFIFIVDRAKDMVLRGGENVYCAEVEAAIYEHPAVAEATVFGVPDDRLGEEVGAAVFLKSGERAGADDIRAICRERISAHKVPRYIWFLQDPLPRNANGKFLKRELKDKLNVREAA